MSDDWRVKATVENRVHAEELAHKLSHGEVEHRLETGAGERVVVSHDDNLLFLYAGTRAQAQAAAEALRSLDANARLELRHWHPVAEEWEEPEAPLPSDAGQVDAEEDERSARERSESEQMGYAEYEVRVELDSHRDTVALAERLRDEGLQVVRRWRFLLVGADDERAAESLATRIRLEAPEGSRVVVEGTTAAVEAENPRSRSPFTMFGGLGG